MPLPFVNFRPLSATEVGSGFGEPGDFLNKLALLGKNREQNIQNQYFPQSLEAQIKKIQIENLLQGAKVPYAAQNEKTAAQKAVEDLLYRKQENQWYGPKAQSDIGLQGAQTNLTNQNAKFKGLETLISGTNALRNSSRFGEMYNLSRALSAMPAAAKDEWIAQHQQEYMDMVNTLADKSAQAQENQGPNLLQQELAKIYGDNQMMQPQQPPQSLAQTLPQTQQQIPQGQMPQVAPGNLMEQLSALMNSKAPLGEASRPFSGKPSNQEKLQLATEISANNRNITAAMKNRADSAVTFDKWIEDGKNKYAPRIENALKYSGIRGRAQEYLDKVKKESPEEYKDLVWFRRSFVPNAINQVKMMERMGATDSQREEMRDMINAVSSLDLDPNSARQVMNQLFDTMQDISTSVLNAAEPLHPGARRKSAGLPERTGEPYLSGKPSLSQEDLEYTAKKHGLSVEEVKKQLGNQ